MLQWQKPVSPDQVTCSVCLDMLKDPVTIPCGHNYCMNCIKNLWDRGDASGRYRCPQCRMEFNRRPLLNRNALLAELTEQLKESAVGSSLLQTYGGPDDVLCDFCIGSNRGAATKTCVTCMANYCEKHLQPHKKFQALKRHKLENPTGNLEQRVCLKHQKVLEIFCRTDQTCICLICGMTEHRAHDTVNPDVERAEKELQLESTKKDLKQKAQERMKDLEKLRMKVKRIKNSAKVEIKEYERIFTFLVQSIERLRLELIEVIRVYEKGEVGMDEYRIKQLQKEIEELNGKDTELEQLSKTDNHIDFLQKFPSKCVPCEDEVQPYIDVDKDFLPDDLRKDLDVLISSLKETSCWELVQLSQFTPSYILENVRSKSVKRSALLKYKFQLTLDLNTAHRSLHLSETNKKVTREWGMSYPDHPDRFERLPQVLCRETLTGSRSYWEVEWTGNCIEIGVTCKGIGRKGEGNECRFGCTKMSWSLCHSGSGWCVRHDNKETKIKAPEYERIGVFLDWPAGILSFYCVSETATLLHMFNAIFTESLCAGFSLSSRYNSASLTIL
ncbi:tripartite motif-containing protein 16-like [Erpetoichthys calabaricus]|uniref:tripartite motif-containing protein 16-like n=1 Tax=Erpetoichthys calabaricus TaxID=27687 RepID=UPI0022341411|nr:tripartite motif-containing protein 16-like [Erpetoichthys calabaricus]